MSRRTDQVGREVRRHLGELILTEMRDPRVEMASVTAVDISPDLKHARVHVGVIGDEEERTDALRALRGAAGYLRTELGRRLALRTVPELRFEPDTSAEHSIRVGELLREAGTAPSPPREPDGGDA